MNTELPKRPSIYHLPVVTFPIVASIEQINHLHGISIDNKQP